METMGMPLALPQKADKLSLTALGIIVVYYNVSFNTFAKIRGYKNFGKNGKTNHT